MKTQIKHPLPIVLVNESIFFDANGSRICSIREPDKLVECINSLAPHLLAPKDIREFPQPPMDDKFYLLWGDQNDMVVGRNKLPWNSRILAWAGPLPTFQRDEFEEAWQKECEKNNLSPGVHLINKASFKAGYEAGRKAAK